MCIRDRNVFGPIPLTHTSIGTVKIPVEFLENGEHQTYPSGASITDFETCSDYMEYPIYSIGDRDDCLEERKTGGIFISLGIFALWGTIYLNKDYLQKLMETYDLL